MLRNRPGAVQRSWRQLFVQRALAQRNHDAESAVKPPIPVDYLFGIEICDGDGGAMVFSSMCELSAKGDAFFEVSRDELLACNALSWTYHGLSEQPHINVFLIRKKDGKFLSLAQNHCPDDGDEVDHTGYGTLRYYAYMHSGLEACSEIHVQFRLAEDFVATSKSHRRKKYQLTSIQCKLDSEVLPDIDFPNKPVIRNLEQLLVHLEQT